MEHPIRNYLYPSRPHLPDIFSFILIVVETCPYHNVRELLDLLWTETPIVLRVVAPLDAEIECCVAEGGDFGCPAVKVEVEILVPGKGLFSHEFRFYAKDESYTGAGFGMTLNSETLNNYS